MKHQLHPSGMESLAKCGIAYENRSILGIKVPQSARASIGTAVDRSVRINLLSKIEHHGEMLRLDSVQDIARDALHSEWVRGLGVALTEEDREENLTYGRAIDTSVRLATLHYNELAPKLNPTRVARKWVLDIAGLDIQVAGEMDIEEGNESIRDTKTSGKSPVKTLADESLQLSTYALAKRQLDGVLPKRVILDYLVETPKRADTKLVQLVSTRTEEHLRPVLARLEHMDKIIKSGIFTPAPIGAWWCSARYCPYHPTCKYAARPVTVAIPSNGESLASHSTLGAATTAEPHVMSPLKGSLAASSGKVGDGDVGGGVSAIHRPNDKLTLDGYVPVVNDRIELADAVLIDKLQQSIEIANGSRRIHIVK